MKILVTAASPWSGLADTATLLAQAGLKPAQPAPVGPHAVQSVADWHTQLLQTFDLHPQGLNATAPLPVGKLWEDMAVGLLRTNLGPADWFLADTRATWVLNFWAGMDPQARFLLLYLPAEAALQAARLQATAENIDTTTDTWDPTACAQTWLAHNRQLLRMAQAQPQRTLLVNTQQAQLHPQRLLGTLATALGVHAQGTAPESWDAPIYLSAPIEALVAPALAAELRSMSRQLREAQTPLLSGGTQLVLATGATTGTPKAPTLLGWLGKSKQAEQALLSASAELAHTQSDLGHAQDLIAALAGQKARLQTGLTRAEQDHRSAQAVLERQIIANQNQADATQQQLSAVKAQLEATAQQAAMASQAVELQQENELLLQQLHQVQEELEKFFHERETLKQQLAAAEQGRAQAQQAKDQADKAKTAAEQGKAQAEKAKAEADKKAAELAKQAQEASTAKDQADKAKTAAEQGKAQAEKAKAEADKKAAELAKYAQEANNAKAQAEKALAACQHSQAQAHKELANQKQATDQALAEAAAAKKALQQLTAKADDTAQENELLLLQLMQAQEELVEYYEQKNGFEKLYEAFKARWERLEKRLPHYVDFGVIEIAGFDHAGEVPSVTWRVKDFAHGGTVVPEFLFQTVLDQGHPGIGLCHSADALATTFAPMLLGRDAAQLQRFRAHSTQAFGQLLAGGAILVQLEASQWQGFPWPQGFDTGFWQSSLKLLVAQLKQLPPTLRFNEVRLKRELVNLDYEHLWLEFHGLSCGAISLKKFEVRLGASNVMPGGFSRYPKFEVPLIDGKHKPFESWFAESMDEHGAKLELRFALDQPALDRAVYAKLSEEDRLFMLRLVQAMPDALKRLEAQNTGIHRPWATWQSFAQAAVDVIKVLQAAEAKPAQSNRPIAEAAKAPPASASAAERMGAATPPPRKRAAAAKVISIAPPTAARSKAAGKTPRFVPAA